MSLLSKDVLPRKVKGYGSQRNAKVLASNMFVALINGIWMEKKTTLLISLKSFLANYFS